MYLVYEYHKNEIPEGLEPSIAAPKCGKGRTRLGHILTTGHLSTARTTLSTVYCDTHSQRTQIEGFKFVQYLSFTHTDCKCKFTGV